MIRNILLISLLIVAGATAPTTSSPFEINTEALADELSKSYKAANKEELKPLPGLLEKYKNVPGSDETAFLAELKEKSPALHEELSKDLAKNKDKFNALGAGAKRFYQTAWRHIMDLLVKTVSNELKIGELIGQRLGLYLSYKTLSEQDKKDLQQFPEIGNLIMTVEKQEEASETKD